MTTLRGKTLFITGATRGIGLSIARRAARDGANIAVVGKTAEPHPKLPGTVHSACEELEAEGGRALPLVCDIRFEDQVQLAVEKAAGEFGGIDILVNNASAIFLAGTTETPMKRYDLMQQVNARGTFVCSQACIPWLEKADNPHILMLSPPLNMKAEYFSGHLAYSIAKFGMSLCVLGLSKELERRGVAVNALWPRTTIDTAAVRNLLGGEAVAKRSRKPEIVADAAHHVLTRPSKEFTGNFLIDDEVLRDAGVTDFDQYSVTPGRELLPDFFVD